MGWGGNTTGPHFHVVIKKYIIYVITIDTITVVITVLISLVYDCSHKDTMVISRYQDWFSRVVQEWLTLSKAKLEARIHLAVQYDKV